MEKSPWQPRAVALGLIWAVGTVPTTLADDASTRYRAVLAANPEVPVQCDFTVTSESSERSDDIHEERFVASDDGGHWQLVSVNGEPPSQNALDDYAKARPERERRSNASVGFPFAELIEEQSVAVAQEDAQTITFSFMPTEDSAPEPQKVAGTLVVDKATLRPLRFVMANTETISPAPTVKMQEFRQEIDFATDAKTGAVVMKSMHFALRGRAMVFKKINEEVRLQFSDYDCQA